MQNDSPKHKLLPDGRRADQHEHLRNNPNEAEQLAASLKATAQSVQAGTRAIADQMTSAINAAKVAHAHIAHEHAKLTAWLQTIDWQDTKQRLDAIGEVLECFEASPDPGAKRIYGFLSNASLDEAWEMIPFLKRPPKKRGRKCGKTEFYDETQRQAVANLTADGRAVGELRPSEIADEMRRIADRHNAVRESVIRHLHRQK